MYAELKVSHHDARLRRARNVAAETACTHVEIYIKHMYPFKLQFVLLGINVEMGPYALFFLVAIVVAVVGCFLFARAREFNGKIILMMLIIMAVSAIIGARVLNALVNFSSYAADSGKLFEFGATGFSLYGGIMMAVVSAVIFCRIYKLDIFKLGDTFVPFLGISIAIMRVGCFLQGCCFGVETDLPWGVKFPLLSPAHLHQIGIYGNFMEVYAVHPTQLYELFAAVILSAAAFMFLEKKPAKGPQGGAGRASGRANGLVLFGFIAAFSLFRLFNSFLRVSPDGFSAPPWFYPVFYLAIIAASGAFMLKLAHARIQTKTGDNHVRGEERG